MVLIYYNVIDILIVPLNASTVYHILEMLVVGIVFDRLSLFVSMRTISQLKANGLTRVALYHCREMG
jgi:hypothetical protein